MDAWVKLALLISVFGFLKEIRPSEPYLYDYLIGDWRDITADELNRQVFPVGTYAYLVQLVIIFLITDFLRYKPLLIFVGLCGIAIWSLLLWTTSLLMLQITLALYATYVAADVAFYPYIYAKVDREHYAKVSAYARASVFLGNFLGSGIGQILIAYKWMDFRDLNYITLATQISAALWSFTLPSAKPSLYFHQLEKPDAIEEHSSSKNFKTSTKEAFSLIISHFRQAYTNLEVLQWSVWYSCGLGGYLIVLEYRQMLWKEIDDTQDVVWNGAVEALVKLLCALTAFLTGKLYNKINIFVHRRRLFLLSILSMVQTGLILLSCLTDSRWISYLGYLLISIMFTFLITISTVEIAKRLIDASFGLVFGINTFFAILVQTIMTIVFISESGFHLSLINQYITFAIYFFILGSAYFIYSCIELLREK